MPDRKIESEPGSYILVMRCRSSRKRRIGSWGHLQLQDGYYLYVGSAFGPGGIRSRVGRHCRVHKSKHWHIDYLREAVQLERIWFTYASERIEHEWAQMLRKAGDMQPLQGFGCSDCDCQAHLFFSTCSPDFDRFATSTAQAVLESACPQKN